MAPKEGAEDIFKDTALRYLGYTNEVGESFRPLVHGRLVAASYVVAGGYVCADAADKAIRAWKERSLPEQQRKIFALERGFDTLMWQGLASVAIPGLVINRIVWAVGKLPLSGKARAVAPTMIGLACIPLIIHPIDNAVHVVMDATSRPVVRKMSGLPPNLGKDGFLEHGERA
ncbi:mitochondrial 18 KDa protein-domain-containing protein [Baffinella frigidus]|nr:mitochondrial 18 KDa protein-domain-containing protein [Cryptophyta sp. CCMP2293]